MTSTLLSIVIEPPPPEYNSNTIMNEYYEEQYTVFRRIESSCLCVSPSISTSSSLVANVGVESTEMTARNSISSSLPEINTNVACPTISLFLDKERRSNHNFDKEPSSPLAFSPPSWPASCASVQRSKSLRSLQRPNKWKDVSSSSTTTATTRSLTSFDGLEKCIQTTSSTSLHAFMSTLKSKLTMKQQQQQQRRLKNKK